MNERIKELAKEAGLPTALDYHQKRLEKFAELIIHECAIVMSKIPGGYSAEKYYESNKIIKQHFGVE